MSMRLTNASVTWQRYINHLLHDLLDEGVVVYLNDVLIYIKNDSEKHQQLVFEVLRRFEEAELYVDLDKTQFHTQEVRFLGHIVEVNGIRMNPDKISAVQDWPISETSRTYNHSQNSATIIEDLSRTIA